MDTETAARRVADIAPVAALLADRTRARIIAALIDGRTLPASVIAQEGGVSASTTSEHLARLVEGGVLLVEPAGRHRYYRLAGPDVAAAVEALAVIAPQPPVTSLRESTRAAAMRRARTCYDHLAGRVGVGLMQAFVDRGALIRVDGRAGTLPHPGDRLAAPAGSQPYALGPHAAAVFAGAGVELEPLLHRPGGGRPLLRFCVDWSEQRYHLAGALGAAVLERTLRAGWVVRRPIGRAVHVTDAGQRALRQCLGLQDVA